MFRFEKNGPGPNFGLTLPKRSVICTQTSKPVGLSLVLVQKKAILQKLEEKGARISKQAL